MPTTSIPLTPTDRVFLHDDEVFALVRYGAAWRAHQVFRHANGFTRSRIPTALDPARVNGAVHQGECFSASELATRWPQKTRPVRAMNDQMDLFSAAAAGLVHRSTSVAKAH